MRAILARPLLLLLVALTACSGKSGGTTATAGAPGSGSGGVNPIPAQPTDVVTYKYDQARI
jgi:hypothetical protein